MAVIVEGRVQYERNLLRGIRDYAAQRGDWLIRLEMPRGQSPEVVAAWEPDGVLFQSAGLSREALARLEALPVPCLHLSDLPDERSFLHVGLDNRAIGRAAARHCLDLGVSAHAFVGVAGVRFSRTRGDSYAEALGEAGHEAAWLDLGPAMPEADVVAWLRELRKPSVVFATHDECAMYVATLARGAGIRIPEEMAILGVDDDTLLCELAWPKLSSVAVPSRRVGMEAAARMDRLLRGEPGVGSVLLPPLGIVSRHSTDARQSGDEVVNRALRFMRSHLDRRINVEDVLREAAVSRRLLERRFRETVGRSPLQELQRLRVERAKRLLAEGGEPLHEIAVRCGMRDASHLVALFRRVCGMTPGEYRRGEERAGEAVRTSRRSRASW